MKMSFARSYVGALAFLFCLVLVAPAHAATFIWTGGTADMSLSSNWSGASGTSINASAGDTLVLNSTGSQVPNIPSGFATSGISITLDGTFTGTMTSASTSISFASSTVAAGTLNTGTNTFTFTGDVVVNGGTVSSTVGTLNTTSGNSIKLIAGTFKAGTIGIGGGLTITNGATWTSSTNNVTFNGAVAQVITDNTSGAVTLKKDLGPVVMANTSGGVSTASGVKMNTLNVSSGAFTIAGQTLVLGGTGSVLTGTLTDNSASTVLLNNDTSANIPVRTYSGALTLGGAGTYTLAGNATVTGAFTLSGTGNMTVNTTRVLTVSGAYSNSGGTVTLNGTGKIVNAATSVQLTNSASVSQTTFDSGNTATGVCVTVQDNDANKNAATKETIAATVIATSLDGIDSETLTLTETTNSSGIFLGCLPFAIVKTPTNNDGILEVNGIGIIALNYVDTQDSTDTGTATATLTGGAVKNSVTFVTPSNTSVLINGGAASTVSNSVTLTLQATGATQMAISNNPSFTGAFFEPYNTTRAWQLPPGTGTQTVYVRFQSADGTNAPDINASISVGPAAQPTTPPVTTPAPTTSTLATPVVPPASSPVATPVVPPAAQPTTPPVQPPAQPQQQPQMNSNYSCPERPNSYTLGGNVIQQGFGTYYLSIDAYQTLCPFASRAAVRSWGVTKIKKVQTLPPYLMSSQVPTAYGCPSRPSAKVLGGTIVSFKRKLYLVLDDSQTLCRVPSTVVAKSWGVRTKNIKKVTALPNYTMLVTALPKK